MNTINQHTDELTHNQRDDQTRNLQRIVTFFETFTIDNLALIPLIYAPDAWFKDPFNEVIGLPAIKHLYTHMFVQVNDPHFVITHHMQQEDVAFLAWEFYFRMKHFSKDRQCIRGATQLQLDKDGYITQHRDYWDAAEELYEKLPVLGSFMRLLKRGAKASEAPQSSTSTRR
ncbi:nuclear transport factor 2 family protein [Glaciimonas sp. PAMC28666]|uniref:nuclear transport factor 2 family protein n=1 Tax=Glaciimonas sp. PAMC28666 TaxID=2807626 RepID=UPI001965F621|nr:nuclear transport factor 2 family protein [Glaciimonas sp. PAMC28666]QRX83943.1 nuclear transport factor 2 family protein [Glaciimonas sp. PAMC28666]